MTISIQKSQDLITLTLSGEITAEDLYAGVDALYEETPPEKVIWDLTNAEISNEPGGNDQLKTFSAYATERGKARQGSKVAVISPSDVQFGMARMSAAFAELNQAAYAMKIFRDHGSALAWLENKE